MFLACVHELLKYVGDFGALIYLNLGFLTHSSHLSHFIACLLGYGIQTSFSFFVATFYRFPFLDYFSPEIALELVFLKMKTSVLIGSYNAFGSTVILLSFSLNHNN